MTPRHAFLIIAHGDYDILEMEISLLDHERSDIYILIDKKSPMPSLPGPGKKTKGRGRSHSTGGDGPYRRAAHGHRLPDPAGLLRSYPRLRRPLPPHAGEIGIINNSA